MFLCVWYELLIALLCVVVYRLGIFSTLINVRYALFHSCICILIDLYSIFIRLCVCCC